jgi:putative nucleotidyltransferase with HDIG domain
VVDARHPLTAGHSQRVTEYSLMIAKTIGIDESKLEKLKIAALLHDIGKIGISDDVLLKNGLYTQDERTEMNTHTIKTKTILDNFRFPRALREVPLIACHHHEKMDGSGYPGGLTGNELHWGSKILAVADVFDALTSRRDYPKYSASGKTINCDLMPLPKVISILRAESGTHFDPDVVEAFMFCLPQILQTFRGSHFEPKYVDGAIESLSSEIAA